MYQDYSTANCQTCGLRGNHQGGIPCGLDTFDADAYAAHAVQTLQRVLGPGYVVSAGAFPQPDKSEATS